jgi:methanogenic corrinoid protein MtbC1
MLPSAWQVKDVKEKLDASGSTVKIVVGGAPFRLDQQLWKRVGADAVGYTASDAIGIVRSIVKGG